MHKYWLFVMVKVAIFLGWVGVANNFWVEVPKNFGGGKKNEGGSSITFGGVDGKNNFGDEVLKKLVDEVAKAFWG